MSEIKKGALVKGWNSDHIDYAIGIYAEPDKIIGHYVGDDWWCNVIEIPAELAAQLETLGVVSDEQEDR